MGNVKIGEKIGRLTALKTLPSYRFQWRCDCGALVTIRKYEVLSGNTLSCGCLRRETASRIRKIHGLSRTPTFRAWCSMRERCLSRSCKDYAYYGGRGITICKRWAKFTNFFADMGECPPGLTLERMNNNKGYSPANCKWATRLEQVKNRRPRSEWRKAA